MRYSKYKELLEGIILCKETEVTHDFTGDWVV